MLACVGANAAPGSRLAFDFLHLSTLRGDAWHPGFETLMTAVRDKGEPILSGVTEAPAAMAALLRPFGFRVTHQLGARALAARYLPYLKWRDAPPPLAPYFSYVSAEKVVAGAPAGSGGR